MIKTESPLQGDSPYLTQKRPNIDIMFGRFFCRVLMGKGAGEKGTDKRGKELMVNS